MGAKTILGVLAAASLMTAVVPAEAQQTQSRLFEVTKSKKLRVCQFPLYYSISYRDPKSGEIKGIDADLSKELAKELDAKLEIVETSFGSFIADLQANKCDIGMFGVGATLKRAQAVEFSKPYLITNIYVVTRKDSKIKNYQIIAPTTWNVGPRSADGVRGPMEQALIGSPIRDVHDPVEVGHVCRSYDSCLVCTVHAHDAKTGEELARFRTA